MLLSGSLPMSSAEMASTIESEFFLTEMAASMPLRMPVTDTDSRAWGTGFASCANAVPADTNNNATQRAVSVSAGSLCCSLSRLPPCLAELFMRSP
jgi:hypothetical protein